MPNKEGEIMIELSRAARGLMREERGVTTIEYAMVASLIAIVCVAAVATTGTNLDALWTVVCTAVEAVTPGAAGPC